MPTIYVRRKYPIRRKRRWVPPTEAKHTGTAALTAGAATLSASATHAPRTYSATSTLTAAPAALSASATFTERTYSATSALTAGAATLGEASPLLTSLISYWKLDEASGTRNDSHGTNHLTDNNTVTQAVGKISNAAQFTAANSEFLSCSDNASLSVGDIDFTYAAWFYLDTLGTFSILSKDANSGGEIEFRVESSGDPTLTFVIRQSGGTDCARPRHPTALSTGTWYFAVAYHDSVNNLAGISLNAGSPTTVSTAGTPFDGTSTFMIGANGFSGGTQHFNGRIDEVGFWKRMLTSQERTSLYNSGSGLAYPFSVNATHTPRTYSATSALTAAPATLSASATHAPRTYSGTSALTAGAATLSGSATHAPRTYSATSTLTVRAATLAASATHAPKTYSASMAATVAAATLSATGLYGSHGTAVLTVAAATLNATGIHPAIPRIYAWGAIGGPSLVVGA